MNEEFKRLAGESDRDYFTRTAKLLFELKKKGKQTDAANGFEAVAGELFPIVDQVISYESFRNKLDDETKQDYRDRVYDVIISDFHKYNNPDFLKEENKGKQYAIKTFIKRRTQYCIREAIANTLGIANDRARTLLRIRKVREDISKELEIAENKVTPELLFEEMNGEVELVEIIDLLRAEKGHLSLDVMSQAEEASKDRYEMGSEVYGNELDDDSRNPLDQKMESLTDLDLYLLMKMFNLLSEKENEMKMCDFVTTSMFQKLFEEDGTIESRKDPVKTAYNKNAKIMRVLGELRGSINMCDVEGCLVRYFCERWNGIDK